MAIIVGSVVKADTRVPGKAGMVVGEHVWDDGQVWTAVFEARVGEDAQARLDGMAAARLLQRAQSEIKSNLAEIMTNGSLAVVTLKNSTVAENAAALVVAYVDAKRTEAIMIGDFLNSLTDAQLRTAFGLTQQQVTNLRTNKLAPAATEAAAIRAADGSLV